MSQLWSKLHTYLDKLHLPGNGNRIQRYGFVFGLAILLFVVKSAAFTALNQEVPFLFSFMVVLLGAWFGGFGPGILATLLTSSTIYFIFLEPNFSITGEQDPINFVIIVIFIAQGFIISMLSEAHRKSDKQKSEFVGIISHELKSPLTSIKGYNDLVKKIALKKRDKRTVDISVKIDSQVNQVTEMINEMLDVTTIETGRLSYHDTVFSFMELVKDRVSDQQVSTSTHHISLSGKTAKKMNADKYRIGQVISNLLSNAIKYSPKAKTVEVHVQNYPGGVQIMIKDFGQGIAKKDRNDIFKPFFRLKKTRGTKGTGIGLYISSQIVEKYKGKIWVESTPKGSQFFVQFAVKS